MIKKHSVVSQIKGDNMHSLIDSASQIIEIARVHVNAHIKAEWDYETGHHDTMMNNDGTCSVSLMIEVRVFNDKTFIVIENCKVPMGKIEETLKDLIKSHGLVENALDKLKCKLTNEYETMFNRKS